MVGGLPRGLPARAQGGQRSPQGGEKGVGGGGGGVDGKKSRAGKGGVFRRREGNGEENLKKKT